MHHEPVVDLVERADLVLVPRGPRPPPEAWSSLVNGLPAVERHRIGSVYRDSGQHDSAIGWSLLTALSARHGLSVRRNPAGRPVSDPPLDVSLSHGAGWVAVAGYRHGRVGVDVEAVREVTPALARRCLSTAELGWLGRARDARDRQRRFTRLWTAKEAYLKAIGTGLGLDPRSFTVDCSAPDPRLLGHDGPRWLFRSTAPATGVRVTLCLERAADE